MGRAECNSMMESKRGSASSGRGYSPGARGQSLKSSSFYPHSNSSTQSIIKDHMVSHYKKIYSAKATIDCSAPKSLVQSVKYNDQIRQERLRKGARSQSAHSLSQSFSRASCSSAQSRLSLQDDRSPFLYSRSSITSSPRFRTSFPAKQVVYPSAGSQRCSHPARSPSELSYQSPEATSRQQQSACSSAVWGNQSCKSFQDPVQKTYSGDLLQKHSQHFTPNKPFTPKTLKSDKSSYLSEYRYYRAPRKKHIQDGNSPTLMRQETYHGSTKTLEYASVDFDDPSQGFSTEHERSEGDFSSPYFPASRQSQRSKSIDQDFDSSSRISPEVSQSPYMMHISAEEEELMYLEFISAVTDDILSRGYFSDRALDRLFKQHIDMNRHQLNEDKMRHLLEMLRKDYHEPSSTSVFSAEHNITENKLHHNLRPHLQSGGSKQIKTKDDNDLFPYESLKYCDAPVNAVPLSISTPLNSPERTASLTNEPNEKDCKDVSQERGIASPLPSEHATDYTQIKEEEFHQNQAGTSVTNTEDNQNHDFTTVTSDGFHQDQAEVSYDGQSSEVEDLGKSLSESLHLSRNRNKEAAKEEVTNTFVSVSDEEF